MCIWILHSSFQLLFTKLLFVPHFLACVYSFDLHSCLLPLVEHEGRWGNGWTGIKLLISKWVSQQCCCWQTCHRGQIYIYIFVLGGMSASSNIAVIPIWKLATWYQRTRTRAHTHTQWTATLLITLVADCRGKECLRDTENLFHISENILYHIQSLRQPQRPFVGLTALLPWGILYSYTNEFLHSSPEALHTPSGVWDLC